jgi:hypothetical protein
MIEVTMIEIALFAWGVLATGYAFRLHNELVMAKFILQKIVSEEEVRNQLVKAFEQHQLENEA